MSASQLRNWSPVYRQRGGRAGSAAIEDTQSGYDVLHAKDTQYHRIAVVEDDTSRYLRFDSSFQSGMYRTTRSRRASSTPTTSSSRSRTSRTQRVLFIGLGGGSAPKRIWRDFPGLQLDVVELDREVVDAAYRYFALPRDPRLKIEVEDGRRFLATNEGPWDVIVVDAFYADSIPFHLATREFLELARSRLAPGGVVATNIIGAVQGGDSRLFRSMLRTYRTVFPTVPSIRCSSRRRRDLAGPQPDPRRERGCCAVEGVPARALARVRGRSPGRRPAARSATASTRRSRRRRAGADGRLRADRRAAAALRLARGCPPAGGTARSA